MDRLNLLIIAATEKINPSEIGVEDPVKDPNAALAGILNTAYAWAGIICVIVIIIAGYLYTTSNATQARITRAKDAIIYAVVGLIMIMMAFTITGFVLGRF